MRLHRMLPLGLIALAGLSLGAGCPTIPSIKDRVVELAIGASTILEFPAAGGTNTWSATGQEDLAADIDLKQLLSDAGVDLSDVKGVKLAGISYRVTVPDPNTGRSIENGNVTAKRGAAGADTPLITNFNQNVDAASSWTTAPLDAAGVTLLNDLLADVLAAAQGGPAVPTVFYTFSGTSQPVGQATSFTWQIKLDLTILGTVKMKVLS